MFTLKEWREWQEWVHSNCCGCKYYDTSDYSCPEYECRKKSEEDEGDDD